MMIGQTTCALASSCHAIVTSVTFASFLVDVNPVIVLFLNIFFLFVIKVPDLFVNEDFTSTLWAHSIAR